MSNYVFASSISATVADYDLVGLELLKTRSFSHTSNQKVAFKSPKRTLTS